MIAMCGKNCVGIASDTRYGAKQQTIAHDFPKIFRINDKIYCGLVGLATDVQTVHEKLVFRTNMYELKEERMMKPSTLASMLSSMLYEKRFGPYFIEPVVAGLDGPDNKPYLSAMDLIGAPVVTNDFVVSGTCTENLYGMCESLFQPDMEPDDLFETLSQALLGSVDRDCLSGWGGVVTILTPDKVMTRYLEGRMD